MFFCLPPFFAPLPPNTSPQLPILTSLPPSLLPVLPPSLPPSLLQVLLALKESHAARPTTAEERLQIARVRNALLLLDQVVRERGREGRKEGGKGAYPGCCCSCVNPIL